MFAMFSGLSLAIKAAVVIGSLLTVAGGITWYTTHWYNKGWYAHEKVINERDAAAIERGSQGRSESDACFASGGVWNDSNGQCDRG